MTDSGLSPLLCRDTQCTFLSARPLLPPPAATAAITPSRSWAILDRFVRRGDDGSSHSHAVSSTAACLTNSRGDPSEVCIELNAPPRPSNLTLRWPDGPADGEPMEPVAAHGGAILLLTQYAIPVRDGRLRFPMTDYFVYSVGTTTPALRRLPPIGGTIEEVQARVQAEGIRASKQTLRRMEFLDMGIIVRSREHFAVAELIVDTDDNVARPEVRVFNPCASNQWVLKKPRVVPVHENNDLDMNQDLWYWETDAVVPWGAYLCWVDYSAGIMLHDVFDGDDDADILFLELPARKHHLSREDGIGKGNMNAYHTLGTTDNGDTLKFAFVLRHDALVVKQTGDGDGVPDFSVLTWKLKTEGTGMSWKEDNGIAGGYNLWAQDDFKLIPRGVLLYPVFSVDDPNEVSFMLKHEPGEQEEDGTFAAAEVWIVSVDMVEKKLKSSFLYVKEREEFSRDEAILFERKSGYTESFLPIEVPKGLVLNNTS